MRPRQFAHLGGQDAYDILGVHPAATRTQIDAARRALVKRLHPDLPTGDAEQMSLVNAAAAILLDDDQRRDYDTYLLESRAPAARWRIGPRRGSGPAAPARRDDPRDTTAPWARDDRRDGAPPTTPASRDARTGRTHETAGHRTAGPDRPAAGPAPTPTGRDRRAPSPRPTPPDDAPRARPRSAQAPDADLYATGTARVAPRRPSPRGGRPSGPGYPQLRWQPPPPGRLALWRERRQEGRRIARGQQTRPSGGPMVMLALFATLVVICAVGGAWIGYTTQFSSGSSHPPAPVPATHTPAHSPTAKPKPTPKPTSKPKPSGKPGGTPATSGSPRR
jgi:curved DNA-binding protein CbpA